MIVCIVLGIISILYGIAVMRIASGTMFFAVWFVIGAVLIALGSVIRTHKIALIPRPARIVCLTLIACGVIAMCVTTALIGSHMHDQGGEDLDYIVVLGAQVKPGSGGAIPSMVLRYRLDTALDYLHANTDTVCVVSGGQSASEPEPEADVMQQYLTEHGIAAGRLLIENRSTKTVENIRNSKDLIIDHARAAGVQAVSVGIVTNNFHVFRARSIARKAFSGDNCRIEGIAAPSTPFYLPHNMLRESLGIIKDLLRHNM